MNFLQRLFIQKMESSHEKVSALIEAMLLVITADGEVNEAEMEAFRQQLKIWPELKHITAEVVEGHINRAFERLRRDGVTKRLSQMAQRVTDHQERLAVFGLAATIVAQQTDINAMENSVLVQLQQTFSLSEAEVKETLRGVVQHSQIKTEQCYVEVLLMMAAADGVLNAKEMERFSTQMAERPEFEMMTANLVGKSMDRALRLLKEEGVEARLHEIAIQLTSTHQRLRAFQMGLEMCIADGTADPHERTLLKMMQRQFKLSDEQVKEEIETVIGEQL